MQPCVLNKGLLVVHYSNGSVIQMSINQMVTEQKNTERIQILDIRLQEMSDYQKHPNSGLLIVGYSGVNKSTSP